MRSALGALVLWPLIKLRKRIQETLGQGTSNWFVFITVSQFHFLFYLSRPLPNTMALPLGKISLKCLDVNTFQLNWLLPCSVLLAYCYWLGQQHGKFIACSAAAILIFRGELAILLGLILLGEILTRRLSLLKYVKRELIDE